MFTWERMGREGLKVLRKRITIGEAVVERAKPPPLFLTLSHILGILIIAEIFERVVSERVVGVFEVPCSRTRGSSSMDEIFERVVSERVVGVFEVHTTCKVSKKGLVRCNTIR